MLAAMGCRGTVVLENAAREPEIADLAGFLRSAGAEIRGIGSGTLTIEGGKPLHGTTYTILPDRIETATYLCAAAACGGDVTLRQRMGRRSFRCWMRFAPPAVRSARVREAFASVQKGGAHHRGAS